MERNCGGKRDRFQCSGTGVGRKVGAEGFEPPTLSV
jgi:hypothetical protein